MNRQPGLVVFGLVLAAGLALSAFILAGPLVELKASSQALTVTGSAIRPISSDMAVWNSRIRVRGADVQSAYAALKTAREKVLVYFRRQGVKDSDIEIPPLNTEAIRKPNPNGYGTTEEVIGYQLTLNFKLTSRDVDFLVKLASSATDLLEQGLYFESDEPQYFFTGLEALKIELAGEAAANARERATAIATKTGSTLGTARGVRVGVFQVRPVNSTEVSDGGMLDTSSRDKEAMAVVTINFAISG